ncbi:enoyl-CoA hydratase-related protein [Vibrio ouci]|uniref:Gamma-carboxygeranoyl-CoA hydratase n=1 Tax=Vibrio ouci TaxID=2499078 RepID=A0A4Y8WDV0_9VIBR|nr:enoyl-CoA hydratase-related protein [Vibrio ouci]TFH90548.1 gamma-carboxygeranoyl-CoA hydratase [Vibrio ouci]
MSSSANTKTIACRVDGSGIAHISLHRPDVANAFNDHMISELIVTLDTLASYANIRGLVLTGEGRHFSAGADIHWMRSMVSKSKEDNQHDAYQLATLLEKLDTFPHPTLAVVNGCAFGGALGLICCCDTAIAQQNAKFRLSEVKLGLVPATIAPYVIRAIGIRQTRRYMLSAELIDSQRALELELIHQVINPDQTEQVVEKWVSSILTLAPHALALSKRLCARCEQVVVDGPLKRYTSELIAEVRVSDEGQEGLNAFLEKRAPNWTK